MLAELFSWWTGQLRDLAAPLLSRASGGTRDALVLECEAGAGRSWRVIRRRKGTRTEVAAIAADAGTDVWRQAFASRRRGEPVVIALSQPFLHRRTTVPAAAAGSLDRVLAYEMDRLTPFAADAVIFSHTVRSRDASAATLVVDVAVALKTWLREPLERLAALSIRPTAIEAPAPSDSVMGSISLDHADPRSAARMRLARQILAGACLALAVATVLVPLVRQSLALAAVDEQIALLHPRMEQVDELRRRIAAGSAGAGQIAAARERGTAALRVLGVLTDLLPDNTYLTSISLRRDRLTIEGKSAAATRLIASMAADPQLNNPSFAAPVVRGEAGQDVFTIQAGFGS